MLSRACPWQATCATLASADQLMDAQGQQGHVAQGLIKLLYAWFEQPVALRSCELWLTEHSLRKGLNSAVTGMRACSHAVSWLTQRVPGWPAPTTAHA